MCMIFVWVCGFGDMLQYRQVLAEGGLPQTVTKVKKMKN